MTTIKLDDLKSTTEACPEAADVKGGGAFMKLGDIKGEARSSDSVPSEDFSLNYERIRF